ncbi:MAG TPA: DUF192 domain-containing protein, partial [Nitrososphaerales archaeon]|nr:DUF192 domain-containing protein [Nitrososphaerales archaeon]
MEHTAFPTDCAARVARAPKRSDAFPSSYSWNHAWPVSFLRAKTAEISLHAPPSTLAPSGKLIAVAVVAVVALLVIYAIYTTASEPGCVTSSTPASFTVNGKTYAFTYVASCEPQREAGLMDKQVTNETTMLFAFPYSSAWSFWMQNTNTSLDMIWINSTGGTGRVVYLALGTEPYSTSVITP